MDYQDYVSHPLTRRIAKISNRPAEGVARLAVQITQEKGGTMEETLVCGVLAALVARAIRGGPRRG